jgi:glycosyltransferase involved in cell wall biosynthesis
MTALLGATHMRVLILAQLFPPDMGGGSSRAYNVVKGLISLGHEVTVVTAFPHFPTGNIPKRYRHKLLAAGKNKRLCIFRTWVPPMAAKGFFKRLILFTSFSISALFPLPFMGDIDVVWSANFDVFPVFSALVYRALKGCPVVQSVEDLWPEPLYELNMLKSPLLRGLAEFISKFTYVKSSAITPISPGYADVIVDKYKISPSKIHIVPGGVNLDRFAKPKGRSRKMINRQEFTVLYIGALSMAYNFEQVLKAAKILSHNDHIRFIIQGGGEMGPIVESKAKKMELSNTTVKPQVVRREDVPRLMRKADALILPLSGSAYVEMGISTKLYEYEAAGKPIICCSNGQSANFVSKANSGIVVKPGDSQGIAKAVLYLYHNRDIAEKMGKAGRRNVEDNFSSEKVALMIEKVFNSVLMQH